MHHDSRSTPPRRSHSQKIVGRIGRTIGRQDRFRSVHHDLHPPPPIDETDDRWTLDSSATPSHAFSRSIRSVGFDVPPSSNRGKNTKRLSDKNPAHSAGLNVESAIRTANLAIFQVGMIKSLDEENRLFLGVLHKRLVGGLVVKNTLYLCRYPFT